MGIAAVELLLDGVFHDFPDDVGETFDLIDSDWFVIQQAPGVGLIRLVQPPKIGQEHYLHSHQMIN
jgi:hypothetical protein